MASRNKGGFLLNENSHLMLNEESVNVELDTSRNEQTIIDDYANKDQSLTHEKIETLEDSETTNGQNVAVGGAFASKKSSPPVITP